MHGLQPPDERGVGPTGQVLPLAGSQLRLGFSDCTLESALGVGEAHGMVKVGEVELACAAAGYLVTVAVLVRESQARALPSVDGGEKRRLQRGGVALALAQALADRSPGGEPGTGSAASIAERASAQLTSGLPRASRGLGVWKTSHIIMAHMPTSSRQVAMMSVRPPRVMRLA